MGMEMAPGTPPEDYHGSIADWCVAMAGRGYPENYMDLCDAEVPWDVWWEVLEECEGVMPGDCSVYCADDKHHETCRRNECSTK